MTAFLASHITYTLAIYRRRRLKTRGTFGRGLQKALGLGRLTQSNPVYHYLSSKRLS